VITATTDTTRQTLPDLVREIEGRLQSHGISAADMRRAGSLETDMNVPQMIEGSGFDTGTLDLERLEGPIIAREIERRNETKFTWFLDGSQKTLPVWRIGVVPIIVGIAVVGILERDAEGACHLRGETLVERLTWFIPTKTRSSELNALVEILEDAGQDVRDPLEAFARDSNDMGQYHALAGNYGHLLYFAQQHAGKVRGALEEEVARHWNNTVRYTNPQGWLVIDGRLNGDYQQAVGFVKDPAKQHLQGEEATNLYSLPQGHRTTAFQAEQRSLTYTMWYQRMWPATGLDARHALIRVDTSPSISDPQEIDDIAAWLMAERIPRPTKDGRWPTLLYPIHQLELMLKRRINAMTVGWPS
jgi:hypothetical protein